MIVPQVGGAKNSDGDHITADQVINGGPSVLYDAVMLLTTAEGAKQLAEIPKAKDFISDAHAHMKYIGFTDEATALIEAAGLKEQSDDGWLNLAKTSSAEFINTLGNLRYWKR